MDFLLPDDAAIEKMAEEFSRLHLPDDGQTAVTLCADNAPKDKKSVELLVLYFAFALGYNLGYGTAISNPNRGLGRVQSDTGCPRNLDGFFDRKR